MPTPIPNYVYAMSGGVAVSSPPSYPEYGFVGHGPILVQGSSTAAVGPVITDFVFVATGGVRLAAPDNYPYYGYTGIGSVLVGGEADAVTGTRVILSSWTYEGSGVVTLGGLPDFPYYGFTGTGVILVQGQAAVSGTAISANLVYETSGGVTVGGVAGVGGTVVSHPQVYVMTGGVIVGGTYTGPGVYSYTGTGIIHVSGHAGTLNGPSAEPIVMTGGVIVGGSALVEESVGIIGSGVVTISGSGLDSSGMPDIYYSITMRSTWNIRQIVTYTQDFAWNIGAPILSWYRVEGACLPYSCPPLLDDGTCNVSFIANILAPNLAGVCSQLNDRYLVRTLKSIKKWSRPARTSDINTLANNGIPQDCNVLQDIPFCQVSQCLQLCDQYYLFVTSQVSHHNAAPIPVADGSQGSQGSQGPQGIQDSPDFGTTLCGSPLTDPRLNPYSIYYDPYYVSWCQSVGQYYSYYNTSAHGSYVENPTSKTSPYSYYDDADTFALIEAARQGLDVVRQNEALLAQQKAQGSQGTQGSQGSQGSQGTQSKLPAPFAGVPDYKTALQNSRGNTGLRISGHAAVVYKPNIIQMGIVPATVPSMCGCNPINTRLEMRHNFSNAKRLQDFLSRSGKSVDSVIPIRYSSVSQSWRANIHLNGVSQDGVSPERWVLLFEWQCTDTVGATNLGSPVWKYSAVFQVRNQAKMLSQETRLLLTYARSGVCQVDTKFDFSLTYDVISGVANSSPHYTLQGVIFTDKIGLFSSPYYQKNSQLAVRIADQAAFPALTRVPVRPIFPDQALLTQV